LQIFTTNSVKACTKAKVHGKNKKTFMGNKRTIVNGYLLFNGSFVEIGDPV
jgi:hypothetical protein